MSVELYNDDCFQIFENLISKGVKVDMVLVDPPYGTIQSEWDKVLPLDKMWQALDKLTTERTPKVFFSAQPFTSHLVLSNLKEYKYEIIWDKVNPVGFLNANKQPLRVHENIMVFYKKQCLYNKQFTYGEPYGKRSRGKTEKRQYGEFDAHELNNTDGKRFPKSIVTQSNANRSEIYHPTQKPQNILEYLIKTYTNEGDTILDFCMGAGSSGVACQNLGRNFIGIEKDEGYFKIAQERLDLNG
jgi:site-specific DNA-methyltransferase (adenine-specific)